MNNPACGRIAHCYELRSFEEIGLHFRDVQSLFPSRVWLCEPCFDGGDRCRHPAFAIRIFENRLLGLISENTRDRCRNYWVAHAAVGIKDAVNIPPEPCKHEFPDVKAHAGRFVFANTMSYGSGPTDATHLRNGSGTLRGIWANSKCFL
jgi:hypothetical protein